MSCELQVEEDEKLPTYLLLLIELAKMDTFVDLEVVQLS